MNGLIEAVVLLALVGLLVWAITYLVPMPDVFKRAIHVISLVFVILYLLSFFGLGLGLHFKFHHF